MEILKGFLLICFAMIVLSLMDAIQAIISVAVQYVSTCINVKISEKNVKLTKLDVIINNLQNVESNIIGFEEPNYYDDFEYDEDYEDKISIKPKNKIGFRQGGNHEEK